MKKVLWCLLSVLGITVTFHGCHKESSVSVGSITIDGIETPYITEGNGIPCLVYGIRQYHRRSFSSHFKSKLRCTFIDSRYAIPDAPVDATAPFTIDAAVEEIETYRKSLGMDRIVLVGHSVLGLIAIEYARRYPDHVTHVIAIGCPPELSQEHSMIAENYWETFASEKRKKLKENNWMQLDQDSLSHLNPSDASIAMVIADAPKRWYDSVYMEDKLFSGVHYNIPVMLELFSNDYYLFNDTDTARIKPPVFLAMGKYDFLCPYGEWQKYVPMFDDLTFRVFDHSGHLPQVEEAEKFDSLVLKWLDEKKKDKL